MQIAIVASPAPAAREAADQLEAQYGSVPPEEADVIVALGGDGFMLRTLHRYLELGRPVLRHEAGPRRVPDEPVPRRRPEFTHSRTRTRPRCTRWRCVPPPRTARRWSNWPSTRSRCCARATRPRTCASCSTATPKLEELVCDGILVSTPAGSTAYNLSAHGPILPLDANVLAMTPISPFRPRRWRGAILPHATRVGLVSLDPDKRPVSATADYHEVRDVLSVEIHQSGQYAVRLLFDPEHNLEQRILDEQFQL